MPLLNLPPEIFRKVLFETMTASSEDFIKLRLVHPHFDITIRASAKYLMNCICSTRNVPVRVLSLQQESTGSKKDTSLIDESIHSLLRIVKDAILYIQLENLLYTYRKKLLSISLWADVPVKTFGHMESVVVFASFHRELMRGVESNDDTLSSPMLARVAHNKRSMEWLSLSRRFIGFVRTQLTVDDLQTLMTMINFYATSTRFTDTILKSRHHLNESGTSGHGQNERIESALLAEHVLWRGPAWLRNALQHSAEQNTPPIFYSNNQLEIHMATTPYGADLVQELRSLQQTALRVSSGKKEKEDSRTDELVPISIILCQIRQQNCCYAPFACTRQDSRRAFIVTELQRSNVTLVQMNTCTVHKFSARETPMVFINLANCRKFGRKAMKPFPGMK